jgi:hypothetical protein
MGTRKRNTMKTLLSALILILSNQVFADVQTEEKVWSESLVCGKANIEINYVDHDPDNVLNSVTIKFTNKYKKSVDSVSYKSVYFQHECIEISQHKALFIYQAYCSGSGCHDRDNWGIIDGKANLILAPFDYPNREWKDTILDKFGVKSPSS